MRYIKSILIHTITFLKRVFGLLKEIIRHYFQKSEPIFNERKLLKLEESLNSSRIVMDGYCASDKPIVIMVVSWAGVLNLFFYNLNVIVNIIGQINECLISIPNILPGDPVEGQNLSNLNLVNGSMFYYVEKVTFQII